MSEGTVPTDPALLRAAAERCEAERGRPVVGFKYEGPSEGPAWLEGAKGDDVTPLATTSWEADAEGGAGSAPAWFSIGYVRRYARRIGAELEEW